MVDYSWIIFWSAISLIVGYGAALLFDSLDSKKSGKKPKQRRDKELLPILNKIWNEIERIKGELPKKQSVKNKSESYNSEDIPKIEDQLNLILQNLKLIKIPGTIPGPKPSGEQPNPPEVEMEQTEIEKSLNEDSQKNLSNIGTTGENKYLFGSNESSASQSSWMDEERYRKAAINIQDPLDDLKDHYNLGVNNRSARQYFWDKYPEVFRIGNKNAVEQALGKSSETEFREVANGDFLAIKNSADGNYMVVPQFDITIKDTTYQEGGIGVAFICQNYDPDSSYSNVKVARPATFERNGDKWKLIKEGELIL